MKICKRTVQRWKKRHEETENLENIRRRGAPGRTTREEDARIIETATQNPLTTAVQVKRNTQVNVGVHTVRKRLHEAGLLASPNSRHHAFPHTRKQRGAPIGFALEYLPAEAAFWEKVVFCDEKMVSEWDDNVQINKENLVLHAQNIWNKCRSDDTCSRVVMNMLIRIREVMKRAGYPTKY